MIKEDKLIITVAPTGSVTTREDNPNLPITPEEIIDEVLKAYQYGASIAHIHIRDPKTGKPSNDPTLYREVLEQVKERCDIIINFSTGGGRTIDGSTKQNDLHLLCQKLVFKPELASLNLGSINYWGKRGRDPTTSIFGNPIHFIESLAATMKELEIKPELEIYDTGMITFAKDMLERNILGTPPYFQFVMGCHPTGIEATPKNLIFLVEQLPPLSSWSVCALGKYEFPMITLAIIMGGHVRVGMEDNVRLSKTELTSSNADLVAKVVRIAKELNREIATPDETRRILGLNIS